MPDLGDVQIAGPSIAELAALAGGALVGDDTLAASGVIARKLKGA